MDGARATEIVAGSIRVRSEDMNGTPVLSINDFNIVIDSYAEAIALAAALRHLAAEVWPRLASTEGDAP